MSTGFQSGGSFLPNAPANFTNTDLPCNFVSKPTYGGSSTAAGTSTAVGTTDTQTLTNKTLTSPTVGGSVLDTSGVNRAIYNPTAKTIANGSATALFDVARTANVYEGGVIFYSVFATDGTDMQSITGMVTYDMVDKAGTGTFTITEVAGNQAKAVSAGTYTLAWTFVTGTGKGTVKLQPTTSLTATTHTVVYTVMPIAGAVTIL